MIHIPVSEFKNEIAECLNRVIYTGERVLLQRHGKDVAAIISMSDLRILEEHEAIEDSIDIKEAQKALKRIKSGKAKLVPLNAAKKELGL